MKHPFAYSLVRRLAGLVVLLLVVDVAAAQSPVPSLDQIFAGWKKRQERVQCIRYTVVGEFIKPKGSETDDFGRPLPDDPPQDLSHHQNVSFLLDMARQRFRMELDGCIYVSGARAFAPYVTTATFDGRDLMSLSPRELNSTTIRSRRPLDPDFCVSRKYSKCCPLKVAVSFYQAPLLFAHGFVPRFIESPDFKRPPDPDDFAVHGQVTRAGRTLTVVKTFPFHDRNQTSWDEFWVDAERDYTVVRQLAFVNDKPRTDLEITYQKTKQGWLPERWTGTTWDGRCERVIGITRQRVKEFVIDPPASDADYKLEARPGMVVLEDVFDDPDDRKAGPGFARKMFRVADDGTWVEIEGGTGPSAGQPVPWIRRHWLALALGLLAVLFALAGWRWVVWRRKRRPGTPTVGPSA